MSNPSGARIDRSERRLKYKSALTRKSFVHYTKTHTHTRTLTNTYMCTCTYTQRRETHMHTLTLTVELFSTVTDSDDDDDDTSRRRTCVYDCYFFCWAIVSEFCVCVSVFGCISIYIALVWLSISGLVAFVHLMFSGRGKLGCSTNTDATAKIANIALTANKYALTAKQKRWISCVIIVRLWDWTFRSCMFKL